MIDIKATVTLRCDSCRSTFLHAGEITIPDSTVEDPLDAFDCLRGVVTTLRRAAQVKGDWVRVLPIGGTRNYDLCPHCLAAPSSEVT
jgi:hypothetical protein